MSQTRYNLFDLKYLFFHLILNEYRKNNLIFNRKIGRQNIMFFLKSWCAFCSLKSLLSDGEKYIYVTARSIHDGSSFFVFQTLTVQVCNKNCKNVSSITT